MAKKLPNQEPDLSADSMERMVQELPSWQEVLTKRGFDFKNLKQGGYFSFGYCPREHFYIEIERNRAGLMTLMVSFNGKRFAHFRVELTRFPSLIDKLEHEISRPVTFPSITRRIRRLANQTPHEHPINPLGEAQEPEFPDEEAERLLGDTSWEQPLLAMGYKADVFEPEPEDQSRLVELSKAYDGGFSVEIYQTRGYITGPTGDRHQLTIKIFDGQNLVQQFTADFSNVVDRVRRVEHTLGSWDAAILRLNALHVLAHELREAQEPDFSDEAAEQMVQGAYDYWTDLVGSLGFEKELPGRDDYYRHFGDGFILRVIPQGDPTGKGAWIGVYSNRGALGVFPVTLADLRQSLTELIAEIDAPTPLGEKKRRLANYTLRKIGHRELDDQPVDDLPLEEAQEPDFMKRRGRPQRIPDDPTDADIDRLVQGGWVDRQCMPKGIRVRVNQPSSPLLHGREGVVVNPRGDAAWVRLDGGDEEIMFHPEHLVWLDRPALEALDEPDLDPEKYVDDTFDFDGAARVLGYFRLSDGGWVKRKDFDGGRVMVVMFPASVNFGQATISVQHLRRSGVPWDMLFSVDTTDMEVLDILRKVELIIEKFTSVDELHRELRELYQVYPKSQRQPPPDIGVWESELDEAEEDDVDAERYLDTTAPQKLWPAIREATPDIEARGFIRVASDRWEWKKGRHTWQISVGEQIMGRLRLSGDDWESVEWHGSHWYPGGSDHGDGKLRKVLDVFDEWQLRFERRSETRRKVREADEQVPDPDFDTEAYIDSTIDPEVTLKELGFKREEVVGGIVYWLKRLDRHNFASVIVVRPEKTVDFRIVYFRRNPSLDDLFHCRGQIRFYQFHTPVQTVRAKLAEYKRTGGVLEAEAETPTAQEVTAAAKEADPAPSDDEIEAENYKKGHIRIYGLDITIENAKGAERSGTDDSGKKWSVTMPAHYGYVKGTTGKDGDHVDVYIGDDSDSRSVWVVDQMDAKTGKFDEHKCLLCFATRQKAEETYVAGFSDDKGKERLGAMTEMSVDEYTEWLENGNTKKPVGEALDPQDPEELEGYAQQAFDPASVLAPLGYTRSGKGGRPNWWKVIERPGKPDALIVVKSRTMATGPDVNFEVEVERAGTGNYQKEWINIGHTSDIAFADLRDYLKDTERLVLKGAWSTFDVHAFDEPLDAGPVRESDELDAEGYMDALVNEPNIYRSFGYDYTKNDVGALCWFKYVTLPEPLKTATSDQDGITYDKIYLQPNAASQMHWGFVQSGSMGRWWAGGPVMVCKPALLAPMPGHFDSSKLSFEVSARRMLIRIERLMRDLPKGTNSLSVFRQWLFERMEDIKNEVNDAAAKPLSQGEGPAMVEAKIKEADEEVDAEAYVDRAFDLPAMLKRFYFYNEGGQWWREVRREGLVPGSPRCDLMIGVTQRGGEWSSQSGDALYDITLYSGHGSTYHPFKYFMGLTYLTLEPKLKQVIDAIAADKLHDLREAVDPDVDPEAFIDSTFHEDKFLEASGFKPDEEHSGGWDRWRRDQPLPRPYVLGGMTCTVMSIKIDLRLDSHTHGLYASVFFEDEQGRGLPCNSWQIYYLAAVPAQEATARGVALRRFIGKLPGALQSVQWPREDKVLIANAAVKQVFDKLAAECNQAAAKDAEVTQEAVVA